MIQINRAKVAKPNSLDKPIEDFVENDYKRADVRSAMKTMQCFKCCYCERGLKDVSESEREGEHYIPRSSELHKVNGITKWYLVNDWNNLMIACGACNGIKSYKPHLDPNGKLLIINPCDLNVDPEVEIRFNMKIDIYPDYDLKNSTELGISTIKKIGLNRHTFIRKNFRKLKALINGSFEDLFSALEDEDIDEVDNVKNQIRDLSKASMDHVGFIRQFIIFRLEKLNNEDIPFLENTHGIQIDPITIQLFTRYEA